MASYRFYWLKDNHITSAADHDCADDLEALEHALSPSLEAFVPHIRLLP